VQNTQNNLAGNKEEAKLELKIKIKNRIFTGKNNQHTNDRRENHRTGTTRTENITSRQK
jgi:hypothetical protein